jgi:signal transduction histidine kinase
MGMSQSSAISESVPLGADCTLEAVLAAWHTATLRLEQTHAALREEVRLLTHELEVKNRELARKNRLADLGQMASHVAHEVRNNLVPVALYLSLLRRRLADDPAGLEILDKISAGFTNLEATVNDLLQFTSERDPQLAVLSVRKVIDDVLGAVAPQLAAQDINTVVEVSPEHLVTADPHLFRRAVLNLVLNAIDAMPRGGTLTIIATSDQEALELEISDTGPGFSDEALHRAFEPFFTTKQGGVGLGLAIVARVAEVHGGSVSAVNCAEGGAALTLRIPHRAVKERAP